MTSSTPTVSNPLQNYLSQQASQIAAQQAAVASGTSGNTSGSTALAQATSASTIGSNFNTFINILTTQLQNQDPTNATDPNQFTQELVEFAGVEQQLNTNNDLQSLINLQNGSSMALGVGYIGNYVEAPNSNNQVVIDGSGAEFNYQLAGAASNVTVSVANSAGQTVATFNNGTGNTGSNYAYWNGEDANGNQVPNGNYTVTVSANNGANNPVSLSGFNTITQVQSVQSASTVSGSSSSTGSTGATGLDLKSEGLTIPTSSVVGLYTTNSLPTATTLTPQPTSNSGS